QGFLIFLFHTFLSKPKRELWRALFIAHKSPNQMVTPMAYKFTSTSSTKSITQQQQQSSVKTSKTNSKDGENFLRRRSLD
ncbi:unnamed protein product, partial [Didymodactylos carnosus]